MKLASAFAAALFATLSASASQAQQPQVQTQASSGPIVRPADIVKVSAHVWAIPGKGVGLVPNVGFIVGSKATLVVETGLGAPNGAVVLAEALKLAPANAIYLVTTHYHPEHDLGAHAFPDAKLIRANNQVRDIAQDGVAMADTFRNRSAVTAGFLKGAVHRPADITFDKTYDLDLGGVKVRLLATGLNHTLGDTTVWVAQDAVLFTGDLAMKPAPSLIAQSSVRHWQATLNDLDAFKPKVVVPAHGDLGDGAIIDGYRRYFTTLQARAAELKRQGKTVEEAVATIGAEQAASLPNAPGRLPLAIRSAYAEAS